MLGVVGETGEELDEIVELDGIIAVIGSPRTKNIDCTTWEMFHIDTNQQAIKRLDTGHEQSLAHRQKSKSLYRPCFGKHDMC